MSMIFLLLVVCVATVGFFTQELMAGIKWFFSIRGTRLCVPLLLASAMIESYAAWGYKGLTVLKFKFSLLEHQLALFFPYQSIALPITRVLLLTVLAMLPQWIGMLLSRCSHNKSHTSISYVYRLASVFIWCGMVVLFFFT